MAERENGVFIDGYYIVADSYEPVLVYDDVLPEQMDDWIFRLEITGNSSGKTEILTLLASEKTIAETPEKLGEKRLEDCTCADFQSSIPQIDKPALKADLQDNQQADFTATEYVSNDEIERISNEIKRLLQAENSEKETIENLILKCAQMKYSAIIEVKK